MAVGIRLESLPIVDKALMRSETDAFRSELALPSVAKRTGGTTGDPWTYELDRQAWAHVYAASIRFWERVGCRYGERVAVLGTPPSLISGANGWKGRLRRAVERRVYPSTGIEVDHDASLVARPSGIGVPRRALVRVREHARGDG